MPNIAEQSREQAVNIKDPALYKEIMCIALGVARKGFDLEICRGVLEERGFNISHDGLVYKAVQILVKARLLKRDYSVERKRIVYRLAYENNMNMV